MESTCDICTKKLKNSHNLARHKRNIHGPEERKYKCTLCDKLYTRKDVLRRHSLSIHEIEETRFETVTYKRKPQVPMTIEKPKPWTPPQEGRITARVAPQTTTDTRPWRAVRPLRAAFILWGHPGQSPMQDDADDWLLEHAILPVKKPLISYEELLMDLYITPSNSDSTICEDESNERETTVTQPQGVYGVFK